MKRIPHELYISLMIIRNRTDADITEELSLLGLELPSKDVLKQLRATTPVFKLKRYKRTRPLIEWADKHNLDYALLNVESQRVRNARSICFHSRIKHILELCLLHWQMSWEDILKTLDLNVAFQGLSDAMIRDYSALFWSFDHMSNPDRVDYFRRVKATAGMWAAQDGFPTLGVSLDMGVPFVMSDVDRLKYMQHMSFTRFAEGMHNRTLEARDAKDWVSTYLDLSKEVERLQPPVEQATVTFDAGEISELPNIDRLLLEEEAAANEEEESDATVVPFARS